MVALVGMVWTYAVKTIDRSSAAGVGLMMIEFALPKQRHAASATKALFTRAAEEATK
jgi:hypothetical protein